MATFFVLPPRLVLAEALPILLNLPAAPTEVGHDLADAVRSALTRRETFALFREELPDGMAGDDALRDGFGAGAGDDVIELRLGARGLQATARRLGAVSAA